MNINRSRAFFCLVIVFSFFGAGCAAKSAVYYDKLLSLMSGAQYAEAAKFTEESKDKNYGNKNALLYYLDRGMLLHCAGEYSKSNEEFENAKRLSDELFTKSVTAEASTLLVSDNTRPYYGEDFERALVNVFCAMNYVMLGKDAEALVEARQVDFYLKNLQTKYGYKNVYKEDAFARYLMGMLYENQKQMNDAFISYRMAIEAYDEYRSVFGVSVPSNLISDALYTADRLGFNDEVSQINAKWPGKKPAVKKQGEGELVIIHYAGFAPEKIDTFIEIAFGKAWGYVDAVNVRGKDAQEAEKAGAIARSILSTEQVRIAFPKYEKVPSMIRSCSLSAAGSGSSKSELGEDIASIAFKGLDDRIARIRVRAIARAAIKFSLAKAVSAKVEKDSGDQVLGWLTKKALTVASAVTETADKRSWRSLPERINIARICLPEGIHNITAVFENAEGDKVSSRELNGLNIKAGKKTFAVVRTVQ